MITHKMWRTLTYNSWDTMIQRCTNNKHPKWRYYGGRGIKVSEEWLKFENFFADMGVRPYGTTLDRIDNNGNYQSGNCKWSTHFEQHTNTRSNTFVIFDGQKMTISQLSRICGIYQEKLGARIRRGWSIERAISTP